MSKVYIIGAPRQSRPQPSGLAAYAARKAEKGGRLPCTVHCAAR